MKIHADCRPCLLRQMRATAEAAGAPSRLVKDVQRQAETALAEIWDGEASPPAISAPLYRQTAELCGEPDPYLAMKVAYTREALKLLPGVSLMVKSAEDPLEAAVRVAIAGNLIDFGTGSDPGRICLESTVEEFLVRPFFISDLEELRESAAAAHRILVVGDNAGENVFDRPLLDILAGCDLTYAARGAPVINDATVDDARLAGIHLHARLVSTGSDIPGVVPEECSREFRSILDSADVVVAKGQGNFETLTELAPQGRIFMLFAVKCPVAARQVDGEVGDMVVMRW